MNHSDPLGLYRALGVSPTATAEEIAAAFRKRSKETHPDTSGRESAEEFVQVSAAYEVLGDPIRKERYDKSSWETYRREAQANEAPRRSNKFGADSISKLIEPVRCSKCGQITAQPRFLSFTYVICLVFYATIQDVDGVFCAKCGRLEAIYCSIITMVMGWWAIPSGPSITIRTILANGAAARQLKTGDERMLLQNATAFLVRGEAKLAYALSSIARNSADRGVSREADRLMRKIEVSGADYHSMVLVDPWKRSFFDKLLFPLMAFSFPLYLSVLLYSNIIHGALLSYMSDASSYPKISRSDPAACANPPRNEDPIGPQSPVREGHRIAIWNNSDHGVLIKVRDVNSGHAVAGFFVESHRLAWGHPIPDGKYVVQYVVGEGFDENCKDFVKFFGISEFNVGELKANSSPDGPRFRIYEHSIDGPPRDYPGGYTRYVYHKPIYYKRLSLWQFNQP